MIDTSGGCVWPASHVPRRPVTSPAGQSRPPPASHVPRRSVTAPAVARPAVSVRRGPTLSNRTRAPPWWRGYGLDSSVAYGLDSRFHTSIADTRASMVEGLCVGYGLDSRCRRVVARPAVSVRPGRSDPPGMMPLGWVWPAGHLWDGRPVPPVPGEAPVLAVSVRHRRVRAGPTRPVPPGGHGGPR
jgi:hypothetical protein